MKTKLVNRYYCEFCNKAGCSASHISRHEKRCTKNPARECGMCKAMSKEQPETCDLRAALFADKFEFEKAHESDSAWQYVEAAMQVPIHRLRKAAGGCPACILAAIRQFGDHSGYQFDFSTESKEAWDAFNVSQETEG